MVKKPLVVMLLAVLRIIGVKTDVRCGTPGYSRNCLITRNATEYFERDSVTYVCKLNCTTEDNLQRHCLSSGMWSGRVPVCNSPLLAGDIRKVIINPERTVLEVQKTLMMMDNNKSTCFSISNGLDVIFKRNSSIRTVKIVFRPNAISNNTIVSTREGNGSKQKKNCTGYTVDIDSSQFFSCYGGVTNVVRIEKLGGFDVCEIIFDTQSNGCVRPDYPYKATGFKISSNPLSKYILSCQDNYELVGQNEIECLPDGSWTHSATYCKERTHCTSQIPEIANGYLEITSTAINSTAWLKCDEGFRPLGENRTRCLPTGNWDRSYRLKCDVIECERNPYIPHGRGSLLDSSLVWGARLRITCDRGYLPVESDIRLCLEDGNWENLAVCAGIVCSPLEWVEGGHWVPLSDAAAIRVLMCEDGYHIQGSPAVTLCLVNGSWSYTSAVCVAPEMHPAMYDWPPSLILSAVAIGAVTAICIICLAVCVMVIRKKRYSKTGTTVFHVGVTDSILYQDEEKEQFGTNTYEDVMELRHSIGTSPRNPTLVLPHLPVDADPVYSQPFETTSSTKSGDVHAANSIYTAHIYAEPVDCHRNDGFNSAPEAWLSGTKKFGRKMTLPGRSSMLESYTQKINPANVAICRPVCHSTNITVYKTLDGESKIASVESKSINAEIETVNSIYLETSEKSLQSENNLQHFQMIDNDIYQESSTSNV